MAARAGFLALVAGGAQYPVFMRARLAANAPDKQARRRLMKHALRTALLSLTMTALVPSAVQAGDAADPSATDKLLAQQNGYVGNPAGGARLRPSRPKADARAMMMPKSAAAALYPAPAGLNPPAANAARSRDIYKSPY
jgi:hypothetical protein